MPNQYLNPGWSAPEKQTPRDFVSSNPIRSTSLSYPEVKTSLSENRAPISPFYRGMGNDDREAATDVQRGG